MKQHDRDASEFGVVNLQRGESISWFTQAREGEQSARNASRWAQRREQKAEYALGAAVLTADGPGRVAERFIRDTEWRGERVAAADNDVQYLVSLAEADADREVYDEASLTTTTLSAEQAALATRYSEGDVVETPSGAGVVAGVLTESKPAPEESDLDDIEASPESPTYVVVTAAEEGRAYELYDASEIEAGEIETDIDPLETAGAAAAAMAKLAPEQSEVAELDFRMPESWRESETPARVIALKAFAGMGGSFDGCVREMRGNVASPDRFCGAFLDEVLGYEAWRGDSPLPGD